MPNRIIFESSCFSEKLNSLTDFEERFWNRLLVNCDDFGRFDGRTAVLKGKLFPLMEVTPQQITAALDTLERIGLIFRYTVQGRPHLQLTAWDKYQRIRAKRSKYPAPEGGDNSGQIIANYATTAIPKNWVEAEEAVGTAEAWEPRRTTRETEEAKSAVEVEEIVGAEVEEARPAVETEEALFPSCGHPRADAVTRGHVLSYAAVIQSESNPNLNLNPNPTATVNPRPGRAQAAVSVPAAAADVGKICENMFQIRLSKSAHRELRALSDHMGVEVCLRAIDEAWDAGQPSWVYLRAILRRKKNAGVRSLEDWDRDAAAFSARRTGGGGSAWNSSFCQTADEDQVQRTREDMERMRRMLDAAKELE